MFFLFDCQHLFTKLLDHIPYLRKHLASLVVLGSLDFVSKLLEVIMAKEAGREWEGLNVLRMSAPPLPLIPVTLHQSNNTIVIVN